MESIRFKHLRVVWATLAVAVAFAQGPRGPQGNAGASPFGAGLDLARQQTIEGPVTSVQIGYAVGYPSIVVNRQTIRLAPVWYLLENDFELAVGDLVRVVAAPAYRDATLHGIAVEKLKAGVKLVMRDEAGFPLWTRQSRSSGAAGAEGARFGGGCLDPSSIATVTGVIESVHAGVGIQHPTLTLRSGDQLLTFKLGPERVLLESGLELNPGATLIVRYAVAACTGELLALALTDAEGNTLVLRTDSGQPAWR